MLEAEKATYVELLILVSDVMVNSMLKNTQKVFLWNASNVLTKTRRRKKNMTLSVEPF